jgi:hypothetical protein
MRKTFVLSLAAIQLLIADPLDAIASPLAGAAAIGDAMQDAAPIEQARVFCYNRYTGRFLYWGHCRRSVRRYHYVRPRVYCYNRYTGRFLHWGSCRR